MSTGPAAWLRRHAVRSALAAGAIVALIGVAFAVIDSDALFRPAGTGPGSQRTPRPSPTGPIGTGFPDASNTGVPHGVTLTRYTGPCTITRAGTVIDAKVVGCDLVIRAADVVIRRSFVDGLVATAGDGASLRIEESEVDAGEEQVPAVGYHDLTVIRSNIHGGQTSVNCASDCLVQDSWLHGQYLPADASWHLDGLLSNGGSNITLIHNTLACDAPANDADGACTAAAAIFGDFEPVTYVTFDRNLFVASGEQSYCLYAGSDEHKPFGEQTHHIVVTNNVFERGETGECGAYGAWTSFDPDADGNVWSGNVWDDGEALNAD